MFGRTDAGEQVFGRVEAAVLEEVGRPADGQVLGRHTGAAVLQTQRVQVPEEQLRRPVVRRRQLVQQLERRHELLRRREILERLTAQYEYTAVLYFTVLYT